MVMAAGAVWVPMLDFFVRRVTKRLDGHLEVQRLSGQRMVRVDRDGLLRETGDEERDLSTLVVVRDHLHSCEELCSFWKKPTRNFLSLADARTVPLLGRDGRSDRLARGGALELLFQAGHDVHRSMQVEQRAPFLRAIDDLARIVPEDVRERDDFVCCNGLRHVDSNEHGTIHEGRYFDLFGPEYASSEVMEMTDPRTTSRSEEFEQRFTQTVIRLALLALLIFLCLRVLRPFINPIIGGIVVAIALHTPHEKLTRMLGGRRALASGCLVGVILLALILPAIALGANMVETATELSGEFSAESVEVPPPPASVAEWPIIGRRVYDAWLGASRNLESALVKLGPHLKDVGLWLVETVGDLGWGLLMFIVAIVIGGALLPVRERGIATTRKVATIVAGDRGPELADLVGTSVQSVIRGVIGVAIIQSVLAGVGMLAVGVPGAGIWALLILLLAVMQLPPTIVLGPVIIYVFSVKSTTVAVIFTIFALIVGASDNVLKPVLMGRGSKTPMLVLFMGSLGGFIAGGILGLFVGAVVLSMGYTVFMAWIAEPTADAHDEASHSNEGGAPESSPESP